MLGFNLALNVTTFQIALLSFPFTVFSARRAGEALRRFAGSTLLCSLALGVAATVLLALADLAMGASGVLPELRPVVRVLTWAILPILFRDLFRRELFAHLSFRSALAFDSAISALQLGLLGWLAWEEALTPARAFAVIGGMTAVFSAALFCMRRGEYHFQPAAVRADFGELWRVGKWLSLSRMLAMLGTLIAYPWIIRIFHDSAVVGLFGVYLQLCNLFNPIVFAIGNVVAPESARAIVSHGGRGVRGVVTRASLFTAGVVVAVAAVLVAIGPWFVHTFLGEEYEVSRLLIGAFALSHLFWAVPLPVEAGLNAVERSETILKSTALGAAMTVSIGFVLVYHGGIAGAVIAMIATNLATATYRAWSFLSATRSLSAHAEGVHG